MKCNPCDFFKPSSEQNYSIRILSSKLLRGNPEYRTSQADFCLIYANLELSWSSRKSFLPLRSWGEEGRQPQTVTRSFNQNQAESNIQVLRARTSMQQWWCWTWWDPARWELGWDSGVFSRTVSPCSLLVLLSFSVASHCFFVYLFPTIGVSWGQRLSPLHSLASWCLTLSKQWKSPYRLGTLLRYE